MSIRTFPFVAAAGIVGLLIFNSNRVGAAADESQSMINFPPALAALKKAQAACDTAADAHRKAVSSARRTELAELQAAHDKAFEANLIAQAEAITALMKQVQKQIDDADGSGIIHVDVVAKNGWLRIEGLHAGDYEISATGLWRVGPDWEWVGPDGYPGNPNHTGKLVARVNGKKIFIGADDMVRIEKDAKLELAIEDGSFNDDAGMMAVTLTPGAPAR